MAPLGSPSESLLTGEVPLRMPANCRGGGERRMGELYVGKFISVLVLVCMYNV